MIPSFGLRELCDDPALLTPVLMNTGAFYVTRHGLEQLPSDTFAFARRFFDQSEQKKHGEPGYARLDNDRDLREQLFIAAPRELERLSLKLLAVVERALTLPARSLLRLVEPAPYTVMKLICYPPLAGESAPRCGVPLHCDASLITLLLQDCVQGLQILLPDGTKHLVKIVPGGILVQTGELLEILTSGAAYAAPHVVLNSRTENRLSAPFFLNPAATAVIQPIASKGEKVEFVRRFATGEHVHRSLAPDQVPAPFEYAEFEHRRKNEGQWCYRAECCSSY